MLAVRNAAAAAAAAEDVPAGHECCRKPAVPDVVNGSTSNARRGFNRQLVWLSRCSGASGEALLPVPAAPEAAATATATGFAAKLAVSSAVAAVSEDMQTFLQGESLVNR
jgi:hypothetical protein